MSFIRRFGKISLSRLRFIDEKNENALVKCSHTESMTLLLNAGCAADEPIFMLFQIVRMCFCALPLLRCTNRTPRYANATTTRIRPIQLRASDVLLLLRLPGRSANRCATRWRCDIVCSMLMARSTNDSLLANQSDARLTVALKKDTVGWYNARGLIAADNR